MAFPVGPKEDGYVPEILPETTKKTAPKEQQVAFKEIEALQQRQESSLIAQLKSYGERAEQLFITGFGLRSDIEKTQEQKESEVLQSFVHATLKDFGAWPTYLRHIDKIRGFEGASKTAILLSQNVKQARQELKASEWKAGRTFEFATNNGHLLDELKNAQAKLEEAREIFMLYTANSPTEKSVRFERQFEEWPEDPKWLKNISSETLQNNAQKIRCLVEQLGQNQHNFGHPFHSNMQGLAGMLHWETSQSAIHILRHLLNDHGRDVLDHFLQKWFVS